MNDTDPNRVSCPGCSKSYRWDFKLVGRTVECRKCSVRFTVPDTPGTPGQRLEPAIAEDGTYALDLDEETRHPDAPEPLAAPAKDGKCPACNNAIKDGAVICLNCGFNLKQGKRIETAVVAGAGAENERPPAGATAAAIAPAQAGTAARIAQRENERDESEAALAKQHRFIEFHLPLILLGIGLLLVLFNAFILGPINPRFAGDASAPGAGRFAISLFLTVFYAGYILLIVFPLLLGGIFFMAAVYGSSFGNLFTAVLKLAGIALVITAVNDAVGHGLDIVTGGFGWMGYMVRFAVVGPVFAVLCKLLFDMEEHETWTLFIIIFIGPYVIGLIAIVFFMSYL